MNDRSFLERYGPWALVAGGSTGLGAEFARQLAGRGLNLLLLAEAPHPLEELAATLRRQHRVQVRSLVVDLARPDLLEALHRTCAELEVGLLLCVAAHAPLVPFLRQDLDDKLRVLEVNCRAPLLLAHHFAPSMARRGHGAILVMSSLAGLQGTPLVATYAASKAFGRVLAESLWQELGPSGVDVLVVCAGPTRTPTWLASQPRPGSFPPIMEPGAVVAEALASLGQGPTLVSGFWNRATSLLLSRLLPRRWAVRSMGSGMARTYPGQHRHLGPLSSDPED